MRRIFLLTALVCSLLSFHCTLTKSTVRHAELTSLVQSWQIDYSSGIDPNTSPPYQLPRTTDINQMRSGFPFPQLIFTHLKNRFGIPMSLDTSLTDGQICLHAARFVSGGFRYLDVSLLDKNGLMLGETRIWNADERRIFKDAEGFAEYAAEKIADLIQSR
jgi:hypothetical protein